MVLRRSLERRCVAAAALVSPAVGAGAAGQGQLAKLTAGDAPTTPTSTATRVPPMSSAATRVEPTTSAYLFSAAALVLANADCNGNDVADIVELLVLETGADCNDNGLLDECDIATGSSSDDDEDGVPDECAPECNADTNGDNTVDVLDLLKLLGQWGACP